MQPEGLACTAVFHEAEALHANFAGGEAEKLRHCLYVRCRRGLGRNRIGMNATKLLGWGSVDSPELTFNGVLVQSLDCHGIKPEDMLKADGLRLEGLDLKFQDVGAM